MRKANPNMTKRIITDKWTFKFCLFVYRGIELISYISRPEVEEEGYSNKLKENCLETEG